MKEFIAKHRDEIAGVLSGFDRLIFRGTLRSLAHVAGMQTYLTMNKVLLKDFSRHGQQVSQRLKDASLARARALQGSQGGGTQNFVINRKLSHPPTRGPRLE